MIHYRPFLNTDPPHLVTVWNRQPALRGQLSRLSHFLVEQQILSKPYFDPDGLILAIREPADSTQPAEPLGFVHATFSPNSTRSDLDFSQGVISQLKVVAGEFANEVADGLVRRALEYLHRSGAVSCHGGANFPHCPFYLGLYGGSEIPGVLSGDATFRETLERNGFQATRSIAILQCLLDRFRPVSGRTQLAIRRMYQINTVVDPVASNWWECCTMGIAQRERFSIYHKRQQTVCGNVSFWDMQPLAQETVGTARGMYALNVPEAFRRSGIATFLVGEALKYCKQQNIKMVEAQTDADDPAAIGVFQKLGFEQIDSGTVFHCSL